MIRLGFGVHVIKSSRVLQRDNITKYSDPPPEMYFGTTGTGVAVQNHPRQISTNPSGTWGLSTPSLAS